MRNDTATLHLSSQVEIDMLRRDYDVEITELGDNRVRIFGDPDEVEEAVDIYDPSARHRR